MVDIYYFIFNSMNLKKIKWMLIKIQLYMSLIYLWFLLQNWVLSCTTVSRTINPMLNKNDHADTIHTRVITIRSILLGMTSIFLISIIVPFFQYTMASSMLGADHLHLSALFLAFFYVVLFNVLLARWDKSWALTPQEFILTYDR